MTSAINMTRSPLSGREVISNYADLKSQHPDCVMMFRIGDFYELFFEDAQIASRCVGLTLTQMGKGTSSPIPMAGFPYHQLDTYVRKLVEGCGYRVAICEHA